MESRILQTTKRFTKLGFVLFLTLSSFVMKAQTSVFDVIQTSTNHTTLEAAIVAAGLDGTLSGAGTFTVFAPTDTAFSLLGQATIDALLATPQGALTDILTYHVLTDTVSSSALSNGLQTPSLEGTNITIQLDNGDAFVNNALISVKDIRTPNGIVHVIDAVIQPSSATVVDVIVNSPNHGTLEAAVLAAGLETTLSGPGEFTVFAPTDTAFAALGQATIDALLATPQGALTDILTYHVLSGDVRAGDLSNGLQTATLEGTDITIQLDNGKAYVNNVMISVTDIVAGNGVVHVIDAVIQPSSATVVDVIVNSPNHGTLEAAVLAAGLETTLSGPGEFTVFAPTDSAFAALGQATIDALLATPQGALTDILTYHVLSGDVRAGDLSNGLQTATLEGTDITIQLDNGKAYVNNVMISVTDIVAGNGVVHVIDAVIQPSSATVVDVIVNSPNHGTLEAAVLAAGLETTLSGPGEFTVFAPTDSAFAALGQATIDALLADPQGDLTNILTYHVVSGDVRAGSLTDNQKVVMLNGDTAMITLPGQALINNSIITVTDIVAGNGVVHVIDAVLLPPTTVTGIEDFDFDRRLELYPNPSKGILNFVSNDVITSLEIYDMTGVQVMSEEVVNQQLDITNLEKGIYILKSVVNGVEETQKLIVE